MREAPPRGTTRSRCVAGFRICEAGAATPLGFAKASETSFDVGISGGAKAIELTIAIEAGKADDGTVVCIESTRSDSVGAANAGAYEMCLDLTGYLVGSVVKVGGTYEAERSCSGTTPPLLSSISKFQKK